MVARLFVIIASLGLIAGCASNDAQSLSPRTVTPMSTGGGSVGQYIKHVVVIIQENRSFENFFAGYPGANAPTYGFAKNHHGKRIQVALHETLFETNPNLQHAWQNGINGWDNGNMDGFYIGSGNQYLAYAYMDRDQVAPYWTMAQQYVLADEMFPTEFGGSWTAHLNLVAGTDALNADHANVNYPTHPNGCDAPPGTKASLLNSKRKVGLGNGPFPCFTQWDTMAEDLDNSGVSWKYYVSKLVDAGIWSPFESIEYVRDGKDWKQNIIVPQTKILTDPGNGDLAAVSWVTPSHQDSDHPGAHSDQGPSWVSSVVNAIGESSYWDSTAIVILWDDWGGWYDNVDPPQLDYRGLAERVPCLIISPYAVEGTTGEGYVDHTQYEYGSILKFIEEAFDLPPLSQGWGSQGYTDQRATSIVNAFDFTQTPRPFTPFTSKYSAAHFLHEAPSDEPVDEQ
jgi:phospholipase C